ncbi:Fic family protein [Pasteurella testudinis]|uniref:Fic family protein n=1 Tax=Pasteurella testudinis TaxID=761 RepID=UPI00405814A2
MKAALDRCRPLNQASLQLIQDDLMLKYNQQSNAIEGNRLDIFETKGLLENGITANGKPFKDHLDILNHQEAIYYLIDLVKENNPLDESTVKNFHYLILQKTDHAREAGKYRTIPVAISGAEHQPPQPYLVQPQMAELIAWNAMQTDKLNPIERAAILHSRFVAVHPFIDGNGRTGRLLLNLELMKAGYQVAILQAEKRVDYYRALAEADDGKYQSIIRFVAEALKETMLRTLTILNANWQTAN